MKPLMLLALAAAPLLAQEIPKAQPNLFFPEYQPLPFVTLPSVAPPRRLKAEMLAPKPQEPRVCAIPLLNFLPKGKYALKVVPPPAGIDPNIDIKVPAPACHETPGRH